jgi:hypothetical protein
MADQYIRLDSEEIELCFTRSNNLGSRIIRNVLEEPVSHVCFMVENAVIHSNFYGVHVDLKKRFMTENIVVYRIPLKYKFPDLQERLQYLMQFYAPYDYTGFIYFAWRAVLRRFLGIPLPDKNKLNQKNAYLCTEFATMILDEKEHGIITPYQLYQRLLQGGHDGRLLH